MIPKKLINKLNELANKSKEIGLTDDEKELQQKLRKKYLELFRKGFKQKLMNIKIIDANNNDVTPKKIKDKQEDKDDERKS